MKSVIIQHFTEKHLSGLDRDINNLMITPSGDLSAGILVILESSIYNTSFQKVSSWCLHAKIRSFSVVTRAYMTKISGESILMVLHTGSFLVDEGV